MHNVLGEDGVHLLDGLLRGDGPGVCADDAKMDRQWGQYHRHDYGRGKANARRNDQRRCCGVSY